MTKVLGIFLRVGVVFGFSILGYAQSCIPQPYDTTAPTQAAFGPSGGIIPIAERFTVSGCTWALTADEPWITSSGATSGTTYTNFVLETVFTVAPNTGSTPLQGTASLTEGGVDIIEVPVVVNSNSCTYSLNPSTANFSASGGIGTFTITSNPNDCVPIVASDYVVNGVYYYHVSPNAGAAQNSTMNVSNSPGGSPEATLTISQEAGNGYLEGSCYFTQPPTLGQTLWLTCTAAGGIPPYSGWSIRSGSLPAGVTYLGPSFGGAASQPGPFSFTLGISDSSSPPQTAQFTVTGTVADPLGMQCSSAAGPSQLGVPYSLSCSASGGQPPYQWSISSGQLPAGLTMSTSTGSSVTIAGTPSGSGPYNFAVQLVDSAGPVPGSKNKHFGGILYSAPAAISLNCQLTQPAYQMGSYITPAGCSAAGGVPPYTWSIASGSLPPGITLSSTGPNTAAAQGLPATPGTYTFTIQVSDSFVPPDQAVSQPLTLTIGSLPIMTCTNTNGTIYVGRTFSSICTVSGGIPPYKNWTVSSQPSWLTTTQTSPTTLSLSGTPTTAGGISFTVQVQDSLTPLPNEPSQFFVENVAYPSSSLSVTCSTLGLSEVGVAITPIQCTTSGGVAPYQWSVVSGTLPAGLALSGTTGSAISISGAPTAATVTSFTLLVTDSATPANTATVSVNANIAPAVSLSCLPAAGPTLVGQAYSSGCSAQGTAPYSFSISQGALPAGLALITTPVSQISGKPTTPGPYSYTVTVRDSLSATASQTFTGTIAPNTAPLTVTCGSMPTSLQMGIPMTPVSCSASGGISPYSWGVSTATNAFGLGIVSNLGNSVLIGGTPNQTGAFQMTVQVADSTPVAPQVATFVLSGTVSASAISASCSRPQLSLEANYAITPVQCTVTGGNGPYTWSIRSGAIPVGLSLSGTTGNTVSISGTPAAAGTLTAVLAVTDSTAPVANTTTASLNNIIVARLAITCTPTTGPTVVGQPYNATCSASGGVSPTTYSPASLPSGLTFSNYGNGTATISGTPAASGAYNYAISIRDSLLPQAASAAQTYTGTISATGGSLSLTCSPAPTSLTVGSAITIQCYVSGGLAPYQWSIVSGTLPSGLTINQSGNSASITGAPLTSGPYSFTFQVSDSTAGTPETRSLSVAGTVVGIPVISAIITASQFGGAAAIAPGTWVEIYGSNLSSTTRPWSQSDFQGSLAPTSLDGVSVSIGGSNAFVSFISPGQINVQVPDGIAVGGQVPAVVTASTVASDPFLVTSNPTQPALLANYTVNGNTYVTATLSDGDFVMPTGAVPGVSSRPAKPGETIVCWGIGFGPVTTPVDAGTVAASAAALTTSIQIAFGAVPATVSYAGLAPGAIGLYQFNVVVPAIADDLETPFTVTFGSQVLGQTLFTSVQQ